MSHWTAAAIAFASIASAHLPEPVALRGSALEQTELDHRFDGSAADLPSIETRSERALRALESNSSLKPALVKVRAESATAQALARLTTRRRTTALKALPWIDRFGAEYGVYAMLEAAGVREPRLFVLSLIEAESGFDTRAHSAAGARGLMQVMPSTARDLRLSGSLTGVRNQIQAGMKYLARALSALGRPDYALAAYSAGISRVRKSLRRLGRPPMIEETYRYVQRVLATYANWAGDAAAALVRNYLSAASYLEVSFR